MGDLSVRKIVGKLWKEHMKKIMNVENKWDQMVEVDMVEGPVEGVTDEEVMEAMNKMKLGKAAGPSEVSMDMVIADGKSMVLVERVLENRIRKLVAMDDMQFGFIPKKWHDSCIVYSYENAREVSRMRAKAVHVFCGLRKGV